MPNHRTDVSFTVGPPLPGGRNALTIEDVRAGIEELFGAECLDLKLSSEYADYGVTPRKRRRFLPTIENWRDAAATGIWSSLLFVAILVGANFTRNPTAPGWVLGLFTIVDILLIVGVIRTASRWWK
jgi:hypothetical protein